MSQKALYQVSLKAFLKNPEGKILILKAGHHGSYTGYFDLPGGRIHDDEFTVAWSDVLKREIKEETGITNIALEPYPVALGRHLVSGKLDNSDRDHQVLYVFFEGEIEADEIKISHEHSAAQWVDLGSIDINKYFISGIREGVEMYIQRTRRNIMERSIKNK